MLYIWEIMLRFSKYKTKHPQSCLEIRIPSISPKIPHHIWTHGIHPKSLNSINKVFEKLLFSSYNKSNFVKQETLKQKKKRYFVCWGLMLLWRWQTWTDCLIIFAGWGFGAVPLLSQKLRVSGTAGPEGCDYPFAEGLILMLRLERV